MHFSQKIEQVFTGRPDSVVPGLALARLLGRPDADKTTLNLPMHYMEVCSKSYQPTDDANTVSEFGLADCLFKPFYIWSSLPHLSGMQNFTTIIYTGGPGWSSSSINVLHRHAGTFHRLHIHWRPIAFGSKSRKLDRSRRTSLDLAYE